MENESVSGTALKEGQSVKGPTERASETTETKTDGGQPEETKSKTESRTTDKGTTQKVTDEDSFLDADEEIKASPALLKKYKDMQKAFSKKTEGLKSNRAKIEAYEAFMKNPTENLKQLAKQYGIELKEPGKPTENEPWEPKTWDDVISRAKKEAIADARREIMDELNPVIRDVTETRKKNIESFLDENAPDWREYEDDMMANLREHPSLVKDPLKLYIMSVPAEVMESRAYQKALKKMQDKTQSSQLSATSTTKKSESSALPDRSLTFSEAVEFAKRQIADKGIAAPR